MEKNKYKPMLCPVCGKFYFSEWEDGDEDCEFYCWDCGWEYDLEQAENPELKHGKNEMSVVEYRQWYADKLKENPDYDYTEEHYVPEPHMCPVCGKYEFADTDSHDKCRFCGWEDDIVMEKEPDLWAGCGNELCLNDFKKRYERLIAENPNYKYTKNHYGEKQFKMLEKLEPLKGKCKYVCGINLEEARLGDLLR